MLVTDAKRTIIFGTGKKTANIAGKRVKIPFYVAIIDNTEVVNTFYRIKLQS